MNSVEVKNNRIIAYWLCLIAVLILAIVIVGGATRLTDSGLSIAHWAPIHGIIPPLNEKDWLAEFELYKTIPQYELKNKGMSLAEFQFIFWWEWAHRLLGRLIGLAYLLPLLVFWYTKKLIAKDAPHMFSIVFLIGLQGFIGWWMVSSGLKGNMVAVAAYRLAIHLGMAFILLGLVVTFAYDRFANSKSITISHNPWSLALILAFIQVILGAFVAGTHSGYIYNDWPTIGGKWLPNEYASLQPFLRNFVENSQTIQFNHRIGAYILFFIIGFLSFKYAKPIGGIHKKLAHSCFGIMICQIALGIFTILTFANIRPPETYAVLIGVAHQGLAAIFFVSVVLAWRSYKPQI